jgi:conflict system STAND superfamily ATPase
MRCPYRGLLPLSEEDEPLFAGRQKEIGVIISSLYASPLTIIYGESGVGKTSLVRAGLLPELRRPEHRVVAVLFREWQPFEFDVNLKRATLKSLLETINNLTNESESFSWEGFLDRFLYGLNAKYPEIRLRNESDLYAKPLDWFIRECSAAFYGRLFFVFDQFEEYIYYHPLKEKGERFDGELARAINDRSVPASFLICLREDGLGKLNRLRGGVPDLLGNIIKLEHLDENGALEAIKKPLRVFAERVGTTVELAPELVETLLRQVDADRLELDQVLDRNAQEIRRLDVGARYKVLALQAVLMRLWKTSVEPALADAARGGRKIVISREALTRLARNKSESEDEVRFIVRTYFDQQLELLGDKSQKHAAEILPHMVRIGSQKKARSIQGLAKESGIPESEVCATIEKLKEEPVNLVRAVPGGESKSLLYELQHDVMAFAVQDWCYRRRQKNRESRLIWYTVTGTAVVTLLVIFCAIITVKMRESASLKRAACLGDITMAMDASGGSVYHPARGLLVGVDTVAWYRTKHWPIPENALMALRLGTLQRGPQDSQNAVPDVWGEIPAILSPDKKYLLAIEPGRKINIFKYDNSWKSESYELKGQPPFEIAFSNNDIDRIGLCSSGGLVQVWDFKAGEPKYTESKNDLNTRLGFPGGIPPRNEKKINTPIDYETLVQNWFIEALANIVENYTETADMPKPHFDSPLFSEVFAEAAESARLGNDNKACSILLEHVKGLELEIDKAKISGILAACFMRRANNSPDKAEEYFGVAERLAPSMKNKVKAQREIIRGNMLRPDHRAEAIEAYKNALQLDSDLVGSLDPEKEAQKGTL